MKKLASFGCALVCALAACRDTLGPAVPVMSATGGAAAAGVACGPMPSGLVAWWPGEGNASDVQGALHGVAVGAVTFAPGHIGQAFNFNGSTHVRVADAAALDLTGEFTLDFWFQHTGATGFLGMIGKRVNGGVANYGVNMNTAVLGLGLYYNDPLQNGGGDDPGAFEAIRAPVTAPNEFHHFAGTYRQASATEVELRIFVDGVLARTRTIPGNLANTLNDAPLTIGMSVPPFEGFKGMIDEVRIFGRALSDNEISVLHTGATPCVEQEVDILIRAPRRYLSGGGDDGGDDFDDDEGARIRCARPDAEIWVVVLGSADFDARTVDVPSVGFGPAGAREIHGIPHYGDANRDGVTDLLLHFRWGDTGLVCGDVLATVRGLTTDGVVFTGTAGFQRKIRWRPQREAGKRSYRRDDD